MSEHEREQATRAAEAAMDVEREKISGGTKQPIFGQMLGTLRKSGPVRAAPVRAAPVERAGLAPTGSQLRGAGVVSTPVVEYKTAVVEYVTPTVEYKTIVMATALRPPGLPDIIFGFGGSCYVVGAAVAVSLPRPHASTLTEGRRFMFQRDLRPTERQCSDR